MAAVVALIFMAAKDRGSAYLDGAHDPQLIAGQPMGFSVGRAVLTENIRNLKAPRCSHPLSGGSVDIYFGPKAPTHKANWIQTVPGKGWNTILRV